VASLLSDLCQQVGVFDSVTAHQNTDISVVEENYRLGVTHYWKSADTGESARGSREKMQKRESWE
jgi:hypothetical protein